MFRLVFILVCTLIVQTVDAEPVLIRTGISEGQGWVFSDGGKCWVATAGHVLGNSQNAIIIGPDGKQGQSTKIYRHPKHDLAIMTLQGSLANACPFSSKGDRDTSHILKRLQSQGKTIAFERRIGIDDGGAFGLDIIPIEVIALSDSDRIFTVRTIRREDTVIQSDSGSPVRMRGSGLGEAGLPLGLVIADDGAISDGYITVLRMDVVREYYDQIKNKRSVASHARSVTSKSSSFTIEGFTGETIDPKCGPLNLTKSGLGCGWKASRKLYGERPSLTLGLGSIKSISGIELVFKDKSDLSLFSVQTGATKSKWSISRPCTVRNSAVILCSLGVRKADRIRIIFEGKKFELASVKIR